MSDGTGAPSASGTHSCDVCNVTLSSFMSYQIHCGGYLHSSNMAALNVQMKTRGVTSNPDPSQSKEMSASGISFDMFDPFISEKEVKKYLKNNKKSYAKGSQQGNPSRNGNPGNSNPGSSQRNKIPRLMHGVAQKAKHIGNPTSQESSGWSSQSSTHCNSNSRNPGGSKQSGYASDNQSKTYIDLTQDDPGYLGDLHTYQKMRQQQSVLQSQQQSVLQSQLALLKAVKNQSGGQASQSYQQGDSSMDSAIKNTLASIDPSKLKPQLQQQPNQYQQQQPKQYQQQPIQHSQHQSQYQQQQQPSQYQQHQPNQYQQQQPKQLQQQLPQQQQQQQSKQQPTVSQFLKNKTAAAEVQKVPNMNPNLAPGLIATPHIGTAGAAGKPLTANDFQFYYNNSLRAEDVMIEKHGNIEELIKLPFNLETGVGRCLICPGKSNAIHRAVDWFCHVEGKKHDQSIQQKFNVQPMPEVKKQYGVHAVPQKYLSQIETYQLMMSILAHFDRMFPAQMQKPIKAKYRAFIISTGQHFNYECKLCNFHGRHMTHWVSHVLGSVHAKTCITQLVKLGLPAYLQTYQGIPGPNPQNFWPITKQFPMCLLPGIQGSDYLEDTAYKWSNFVHMDMADPKNNILSRLKDGKLRNKPQIPSSSQPAAVSGTSGAGVQPLMSLPIGSSQGQEVQQVSSSQGQFVPQMQANMAATATTSTVQPEANLVELVKQKVQAEVFNSVQQNTVLLKAFLGALVQKISTDGKAKPEESADPLKKVVLDYSHGQKVETKDTAPMSVPGDKIAIEDMEISGDEDDNKKVREASNALLAAAPWKTQSSTSQKKQESRKQESRIQARIQDARIQEGRNPDSSKNPGFKQESRKQESRMQEPRIQEQRTQESRSRTQESRTQESRTQETRRPEPWTSKYDQTHYLKQTTSTTRDSDGNNSCDNKASQSLIKWKYNWNGKPSDDDSSINKYEGATQSKQISQNVNSQVATSSTLQTAKSTIQTLSNVQGHIGTASSTLQHTKPVPVSLSYASQGLTMQNNPMMNQAVGMQQPTSVYTTAAPIVYPTVSAYQSVGVYPSASLQTAGTRMQAPPVMYMQPQVMPVGHAVIPPPYQAQNMPGVRLGVRPNVTAAGMAQNPAMIPRQFLPPGVQQGAVPGVRMPITHPPPGYFPPVNIAPPSQQAQPLSGAYGRPGYGQGATAVPNIGEGNTHAQPSTLAQTNAPWQNQNKNANALNTVRKANEVQKALDMVDRERNRADNAERRNQKGDRDHDKDGETSERRDARSRFDDENLRSRDNTTDYHSSERSHSRDRHRHDRDRHDRKTRDVSKERSRSTDRSRRNRRSDGEDIQRSQEGRHDRLDERRKDDTDDSRSNRRGRRDRNDHDRKSRGRHSASEERSQSRDRRYRDENDKRRLDDSQERSFKERGEDDARLRRQHRVEAEDNLHDERLDESRRRSKQKRKTDRDIAIADKYVARVSDDSEYRQHRSRTREDDEVYHSSRERSEAFEEVSHRRQRKTEREKRHRRRHDDVDEERHELSYGDDDLREPPHGEEETYDKRRRDWYDEDEHRRRDYTDTTADKGDSHRKRRHEEDEDLHGKRRHEDYPDRRFHDEEEHGDTDYRENPTDSAETLTQDKIMVRLKQLVYSLGIRDKKVAAPLINLASQMDPVTLQQLLNPDFLTAVGQIREVLQEGSDPALLGALLDSNVMKDQGIYQLLQLLGLDVDALKVLHESNQRNKGNVEGGRNRHRRR